MRKCKLCSSPTGIYLKEHRLALCPTCYPTWFEKQVAESMRKFRMLGQDEKVILAVSGGKDSLSLWQILSNLGIEADALYVDLGIQENDYSKISKEKCIQMQEKLGRKLYVVDLKNEAGGNIDEISKVYPKTCSACGTVKRYFMNKITLEHDYTVIATGHNLDDEVTTLFGNLVQWDEGYLNRQYPVIPAKQSFAKKIKPLIRNSERQVAIYAITTGIDYIQQECPYSVSATSISYKENLNRFETDHPGILRFFLHNFFKSRKKMQENNEIEEVELSECSRCGQLTLAEVCRYCKIKEKVSLYNERKQQKKD